MKQNVSGPMGAVIVVVILGLILYFGYTMFLKGPAPQSPEEMRQHMQQAMQGGSKPSGNRPPGGGPPGGPGGTGGPPPGASGPGPNSGGKP